MRQSGARCCRWDAGAAEAVQGNAAVKVSLQGASGGETWPDLCAGAGKISRGANCMEGGATEINNLLQRASSGLGGCSHGVSPSQ